VFVDIDNSGDVVPLAMSVTSDYLSCGLGNSSLPLSGSLHN
jgi:hypothetical protein